MESADLRHCHNIALAHRRAQRAQDSLSRKALSGVGVLWRESRADPKAMG